MQIEKCQHIPPFSKHLVTIICRISRLPTYMLLDGQLIHVQRKPRSVWMFWCTFETMMTKILTLPLPSQTATHQIHVRWSDKQTIFFLAISIMQLHQYDEYELLLILKSMSNLGYLVELEVTPLDRFQVSWISRYFCQSLITCIVDNFQQVFFCILMHIKDIIN